MSTQDVWSAGALDARGAANHCGCSLNLFSRIAQRERFPKKWLEGKAIYAKAALNAFLANLPESPPPRVRARLEKMRSAARAK